MQLEKLKSKMGLTWPNMALTKKWDLRPNLVSFLGKQKNRRREEKGRRRRRGRGRGREEEDKGEKFKQGQKGMELCIDLYGYMFVGCGL